MVAEQILFLDLETTGLDPRVDLVLEAAMVCADLSTLEIKWKSSWLAGFGHRVPTWVMEPKVQDMHEKSGLLRDLHGVAPVSKTHPLSREGLEQWALNSIEINAPEVRPGELRIAGYSPQFDLGFLQVKTPLFVRFLSHRMIDVSTLRGLFRSWGVEVPKQDAAHRALKDCYAALEELRSYRARFVAP